MRLATMVKVSAVLAILGLAACGPKTGDGVSYDNKSKGDLVSVCKSMVSVNFTAYRMRKNISERQERRIVNECCKVVNREAGKLSATQRAWLWYRWQGHDDINQTPNQIAALRSVETALRGDLNQAQYLAASSLKANAEICSARAADQL